MKKKIFENFVKIINRTIRKAKEENKRLGLPNVYSRNNQVIYEMPDGTITTKNPFKN